MKAENYFYIVTINEKGKTVIIGPYASRDKAEMEALNSNKPDEAHVVPLATKNLSRATQLVKGMKFSELGDVDKATDSSRHSMSGRKGEIRSNGLNGTSKNGSSLDFSNSREDTITQRIESRFLALDNI